MINKRVYITEDVREIGDITNYNNRTEFGKKPPYPIIIDVDTKLKVIINPQYVVSIEQMELSPAPIVD